MKEMNMGLKKYTVVLLCGERVVDYSYCSVDVYIRRMLSDRFILCEDTDGTKTIVAVEQIQYVEVEED